jgi:hypothetical protein
MTNEYLEPEVIDLVKKIITLGGDVKNDIQEAAMLCTALTAVGCMIYEAFGKDPAEFGTTVMSLAVTSKEAIAELKANGVVL